MSRIQVLSETVAHQIAAGEVVERPASVLKELIENAIDAASTRIEVELQGGGRQRIRVRDNGIGMDRADAELAFSRHATSKIRQIEDLNSIRTLGFRGEALPSIASVSRLSLKTRPREPAGSGTEIVVQGGRVVAIRESGWPEGTEVDVQDLFFNVPARKKFIKAPATELSHCMRLVAQYAIVHPEIHFEVENERGNLFSAPPVPEIGDRVLEVYGRQFLDNLVPLDETRGRLRVYGLASLPHEQRSNRYSQFFFVNGRMVRDKTISSAVAAAYRQLIPSGTFPVILLFVEVSPDEIDVNVHPAKTEIRFRDGSALFGLIRSAIEKGLLTHPSVPEYPVDSALPSGEGREIRPYPPLGPFSARAENQAALAYQAPYREGDALGQQVPMSGRCEVSGAAVPEDHLAWPGEVFQSVADMRTSEPPRAMGQFLNSFIVASDRLGLFVVDQHVAHERILYDQSLAQMQRKEVPVQRLLTPRTIPVPAARRGLIGYLLPELNASGFESEAYGGDIVVQAAPVVARDADVDLIVKEILEGLDPADRKGDVIEIRKRIAVSMACRAAIKINTPLSPEKMQWLLDELYRTENPTTCPHGRPVLFRLGLPEILRNFRRI
ncbi:MAG: DNA mismatch repair endonuclease MutL [Acidobacteria bacterium]|nr:DNA mismatch repair endonuclease MutL [Acidobacteriota bacterium]